MQQTHLTLCSTARLARSLCLADGRERRRQGVAQWRLPQVLTLGQWLETTVTQAMLAGDVSPDVLPRQALSGMAERLLWERAIQQSLAGEAAHALFDIAGMAQSAAEANALMLEWGIVFPAEGQPEETRQFLRWRDAFRELCRQHEALEAARRLDLQIDCLQRGAGSLPARIELAGFDRISPQERRLFDVLVARGVSVTQRALGLGQPARAAQLACDDAEAECRAVAAWAAQHLAANPLARLAIVAPELGALRARLAAILDDTLHPAAIHPAMAEIPRCYDFSLGQPLSAHPVAACALALLRLGVQRQRIAQPEMGQLLRDAYWSAGNSEADARARLEARMRPQLPATLQLGQVLRLARREAERGLPLARLLENLEALQAAVAAWPKKQPPSAWAGAFGRLLDAAGWPGERSLSSHEFQARRAWAETLAEFAGLDGLLGLLTAGEALSRLARICRERVFQPEAESEPQLLVMGMLETTAEPLDAIWVMGMNDHVWPPPARPNPLLPAEAQRRVGAPNSSSRVQAEFAAAIHARLLHSARAAIFSWSRKDGERELRASPLVVDMPEWANPVTPAATLAERLAQPADMAWLDDSQAPPVAQNEKVRGGTGLLKAQAICPAWAYFQYRLGARALDEPVEGLDAMDRGNLLHAVLQCFWQGRDSRQLQALDESALQVAIVQAVEDGVQHFSATLDEPLPPRFLALEKLRLQRLLAAWLELEKTRLPFAVEECERQVSLEIAGMAVSLTLDRVDRLDDGRLVVLDYKTGAAVSHKSWAEDRITEPQLPIYAALALSGGEVAAVCFAKVRADEQKFIGITAEAELLPGVEGLENARKLFPEDLFPGWPALLDHWKTSITAVAEEIRAGAAAVRFDNEDELRDCEVKPLLRLPERKLQMERGLE